MEKKPMTEQRARELISYCINATLYSQGIIEDKPKRVECTLAELMEANSVLELFNQVEDAKPGGKKTRSMTVADRGLAAVYTGMSFVGGSPEEPNIVAYANGNYVMVIHERHLRRDQEKELEPLESKEGGK